jgi:hypothetical protein
MTHQRAYLGMLAIGLNLVPHMAGARQAGKVYRRERLSMVPVPEMQFPIVLSLSPC